MAIYIIKATIDGKNIRISIPAKIIKNKGWSYTKYFLLDDLDPDTIVMRRFLDDEDVKTE